MRVVFEERVFFDTGNAAVRKDAEPVMNIVSDAMRKEVGDTVLFIAGHTDSRGGDAYNLDLSVKRAESVAQALAIRGVGKAKLWKVGFGKAVPLRPNTTDQNMAVNRRVEFILADKSEAVAAWLSHQPKYLCSDPNGQTLEVCKTTVISPTFVASELRGPGIAPRTIDIAIKPLQVEVDLKPPPVIELNRPER